jgi:nitrite reductase/ring-hydroxylating ferredoxin subunit
MTEAVYLCHIDEIPNPGSKEFQLEQFDLPFFIVKKGENLRAYVNNCPHTGAPLNWQPDKFLNYEQDLIQCSLHMAIFDISSGKCIAGPCVNKGLHKVEIKVQNGDIYLNEKNIGKS